MSDVTEYVVLAVFSPGFSRGDVQMSRGGQPTEPDTRDDSAPGEYHLDTVFADGPKDAISTACLNVVKNASASGSHTDWARRVAIARDADLYRAVPTGAGQKFSALGTPVDREELTDFGMGSVLGGSDMGNMELPDGEDALEPQDRHLETDGGTPVDGDDQPADVYQDISGMELSDDSPCSTLQESAEQDVSSPLGGIIPDADVKLAQISLTFVDENGSQREWTRSADGYDPEDFEHESGYCDESTENGEGEPLTDGGEDTETITCSICGNPIEGESELSPDGESHPECNTNFAGDGPMTDGGENQAEKILKARKELGLETDFPQPAHPWERKAHENVQKWGLQPMDALLLAMGEELGELAGEVHGYADYPEAEGEDARMAEFGRDLIRRIHSLGCDIQDFLETVSEQDGEPVPVDERPDYLNPFPNGESDARRERLIRSELDDLMSLGYQFLWAMETRGESPEPMTDGGVKPSAVTYTLSDENDDVNELTPEYVARFAAMNPKLRLESATFRAMTDGTEDGIPRPEFPDPTDRDPEGLYWKYTVLKDGEPQDGCFVLRPESDPAAREALAGYAYFTDDEELETDLNQWLDEIHSENSEGDGS